MGRQKSPVEVTFKLRDPPPQNITNFYASVEITFLPGSIVQLKITSSPENLLKIKNVEISQVAGIVVSQFTYKDTITIQFLNYDFKDKKIFHLNIELFNNTFYPTIKAIVYNPKQTRAPRFFFSYLYPLVLEIESGISINALTIPTGLLRNTHNPKAIENIQSFSPIITKGVLRLPLVSIGVFIENLTVSSIKLSGGLIKSVLKDTKIPPLDILQSNGILITGGLLKFLLIKYSILRYEENTLQVNSLSLTSGSLRGLLQAYISDYNVENIQCNSLIISSGALVVKLHTYEITKEDKLNSLITLTGGSLS